MPFKRNPQKFPCAINTVVLGTGDKAVTMGGESVLPLYTFDAPIENRPLVGVEVIDTGVDMSLPGMAAYYAGAETVVDQAVKAAAMPGADFLAIRLESADPNGTNTSVEDCVALCKAIAEKVDVPMVIEGCKNADKDKELFEKIADALQGRNVLFASAKEENYKGVAASVGLAYSQKIGAESAVDINLAKQLNVMINQMGVQGSSIVMNLGAAAAGYGFEYLASTYDRVRGAALSQNDTMLQMPIISLVAGEAWGVKEAIVSEKDFPEWGPVEARGVSMEITTAAACLAAGSNAVIVKHPESVATLAKFVGELM
jgi:acetyl-CoA decarbonylase/synthase complex subunit delta